MPWVSPKTNWDAADYINYADFNRIEGNIDAICDLIETYTVRPVTDTIKVDWSNTDLVYAAQLNRIEDNINDIKLATAQPYTWVAPVTAWATGDCPNYADWNRIEGNLIALYDMVNGIISEFEYCNGIISGQEFNLGGV